MTRLANGKWETDDPILEHFRFTNAYRASDRVSQFLICNVIYDREREWRDVWLRVLLFKIFNRIETWVQLENEVGEIDAASFDVEVYAAALDKIKEETGTIYSAAYIMPSAGVFGSRSKHVNHLRLINQMLSDVLHIRLSETPTANEGFHLLLNYPSIGPFLAYQLLTDLSYTPYLPFDESEFVAPGPGALDGMHKCFSDPGDLTPAQIVNWAMESQSKQFEQRDIDFQDLWGRPLQLIDCQNLFCEIGKYARQAFPGVVGNSGRTRIKQVFRAASAPLSAWYPPKWGLNERVEGWLAGNGEKRQPAGLSQTLFDLNHQSLIPHGRETSEAEKAQRHTFQFDQHSID